MDDTTAVMLCGHGSRDTEAVAEFNLLAGHLRQRLPGRSVESGFLEFARPTIQDGMEKLIASGARRILALPGMLFAAGHVKNDLPWEMQNFAAGHGDLQVKFGRDLAVDLKLLRAAAERIEAAERTSARKIVRADTLLLVVGRGTNDPDANSNIAKVARMLWEGMGFGWTEIAFSGVTTPLVDEALARVTKLGFARIIVFPYFLFTGILVKRIYGWTEAAAALHPQIEFLKAGYLRDHPLVIDTFIDRLHELEGGNPAMNCQLCKYREQALGYEGDVGTVQTGHHHHVRGIGTDDDHAHDHHGHDHHHHDGHEHHGHHHDHGHGHDHGHHHHHAEPPRKLPGDAAGITALSFAMIEDEADLLRFPGLMRDVAARVIHACAMPDIAGDIHYSRGAAEAGRAALESGMPVFADASMVAHGIIRPYLPADNDVICTLHDSRTASLAIEQGGTRSAAAVDLWGERLAGAIVAIGNAPTALFRLLELIRQGGPRPALILGFPVGFVGAAESKEALIKSGLPFIALRGRRGGSAMAAAAINALAKGNSRGQI